MENPEQFHIHIEAKEIENGTAGAHVDCSIECSSEMLISTLSGVFKKSPELYKIMKAAVEFTELDNNEDEE